MRFILLILLLVAPSAWGFTREQAEKYIHFDGESCVPKRNTSCMQLVKTVRCVNLFEEHYSWNNIPDECTESINKHIVYKQIESERAMTYCAGVVNTDRDSNFCVIGYTHDTLWRRYLGVHTQ